MMRYFIFVLFYMLEVEHRGVDVEGRHETFFPVDAQSRHLRRMLVDEPLREPETKHRFTLLDDTFF